MKLMSTFSSVHTNDNNVDRQYVGNEIIIWRDRRILGRGEIGEIEFLAIWKFIDENVSKNSINNFFYY